ncbi:KH domain-containing protein [Giardia duodenalis]|uniref:KH domain-containing protein n=1 Tax=Giardia intestinalis (strain ATCC 50803 / WB clone C6) TaxID=184922 RepID=A8BHF4_GIAIC|nr:KH domain-containing protein [Giardia intestinalis]KAE8301651.1 KH domain-containing protein [Giardia intestinalis]|eukprot:XP_001707095.1 Hypothetical protein GL50803_9485 [Giardia lamblia ATCC 50803]
MPGDPSKTYVQRWIQDALPPLQTEKIAIEVDNLGYMVGTKGSRIGLIRQNTGAAIHYMEDPPGSKRFYAVIKGTTKQLADAKAAIYADVLDYHRWVKRGKGSLSDALGNRMYPYSLVLRLPPGGSRFYSGPGYQSFLELSIRKDIFINVSQQDELTVRAASTEALMEAVQKVTDILNTFVSLAAPIPNWTVGRVIGRNGEALAKVSDIIQIRTNSRLICFISNTHKAEGLVSYFVVLADKRDAVTLAMQMVFSRISSITIEAGLFVPVMETENVIMLPIDSTSLCSYGLKAPLAKLQSSSGSHSRKYSSISMDGSFSLPPEMLSLLPTSSPPTHARHFSTVEGDVVPCHAVQTTTAHRRLNSSIPYSVSNSTQSDGQQSFLFQLSFPNSSVSNTTDQALKCNFCCAKRRSLLPCSDFLRTPYTVESLRESTVAVDRRYLVMHVPEHCDNMQEFWQSSLLAALATVGREFFFIEDPTTAVDFVKSAFDFTVSCSPGRCYYASRTDELFDTIYDISEGLSSRRVRLCFDSGMDDCDYTKLFASSKTHYAWYTKQLMDVSISDALPNGLAQHLSAISGVGGMDKHYSMWHSLNFDCYVQPPGRKSALEHDFSMSLSDEDIPQLQDAADEPAVSVSGLGISYILQSKTGYDILVKITLVPKSLTPLVSATDETDVDALCRGDARLILLRKYIKNLKTISSNTAYTSPITTTKCYEVQSEPSQFGEALPVKTHVITLNLPDVPLDVATHIDPTPLSLEDLATGVGYSTAKGLLPPSQDSKFPMPSTVLIQDHPNATLNRVVFAGLGDIVATSSYLQELPHVAKPKLVVDFRPFAGYRWRRKGLINKVVSFTGLVSILPSIVSRVKEVLKTLPDQE